MALLQETSKFQKELKRKEKDIKRLLRRKRKLEEQIFKLAKLKLEEKKEKFYQEKQRIKEDIEAIEKKEEEIKAQKKEIEAQEEKETELKKKREIEKERWKLESKERGLEKLKWKLEDKLSKIEKEVKKINKKLEKEVSLRDQLKKIEEEIKEKKAELKVLKERIQEIKKLEEEFKRAWKEFLGGNISSALKKLEKIQKELSEKIKEVREEKKKPSGFLGIKIDKRKKEFFEPLEYYRRGDISGAADTLEKLLEKIKEKTSSEEKEGKLVEEKTPPEKELIERQKKKDKEFREMTSPEPIEKPSVVIIKEKEKEKPEDVLGEFKKKLEEERERIIEEEREKLKKLREELERRQKEMLEATIKGKALGLEEKKLRQLQEELIQKELEIEKQLQEKLRVHKERLARKKEELAKAQKSLSSAGLTEEERQKREKIIQFLREKIEEERRKIENKELAEKKEKEITKEKKLTILQNAFEQALSFYNEKELEKAKEVFSIIKEQLEQGQRLGLFVNLNNIPIYTKTVYFLQKLDEELKKAKKIEKKLPKKEIEPKEVKRKKLLDRKVVFLSSFSLSKILNSLRQTFFPLPIIGLDLSDYSLELLHLSKDKKVVAFSRQILKPGILVDGKVKDPKSFSAALSSLLKNAGFPTFQPKKGAVTKAVVSLPDSAVYTMVFRFENPEKLFKQVEEELEKTFPLPLEEIYWDYVVCGQDRFGRTKIMCTVAERDVIDTLVYSLRANGIEPVALEAGILSIGRALFSQLTFKEKIGVLDIGAYVTTFNIFNEKGFIDFSTSMPYAGYSFQTKIADFFKISAEEAEKAMMNQGFFRSPVKEILEEEIKKIVVEIEEAMKYYQEVFGNTIKKIFIIGGCASLPGIVETFTKYLPSITVEVANPFTKIKLKKPLLKEQALLFVNALGLALRAVSKNPVKEGVNLLPEELKRKEKEVRFALIKKRLFLIKMAAVIVFLLLILIILYFLFRK